LPTHSSVARGTLPPSLLQLSRPGFRASNSTAVSPNSSDSRWQVTAACPGRSTNHWPQAVLREAGWSASADSSAVAAVEGGAPGTAAVSATACAGMQACGWEGQGRAGGSEARKVLGPDAWVLAV
jgi:hypothetical protein